MTDAPDPVTLAASREATGLHCQGLAAEARRAAAPAGGAPDRLGLAEILL